MAQPSLRVETVPTIPGLERSFARLTPWHAGQAAGRSVVTNASNGFSQSRH